MDTLTPQQAARIKAQIIHLMLETIKLYLGILPTIRSIHIMLFKSAKIKDKIMKKLIILVGLMISFGSFSQGHKKQVNKDIEVSFSNYLRRFKQLELPLDIYHLYDLGKYSNMITKEINGKTVLVPNPLCPTIPINEYKYLKDKYSIGKSLYYQSVYKKTCKNYILLVIIQNNRVNGDYFLKLNIHRLSGDLIDTLSLAGQRIDKIDRFGSIDSNLKIKIRTLNFISDTPSGQMNAIEIKEEYQITDYGYFKRTYFMKEKGVFIIKNGDEIRVD